MDTRRYTGPWDVDGVMRTFDDSEFGARQKYSVRPSEMRCTL